MEIEDRIKGYLGLSARSGKIKFGSEICLNELRKGNIELLILSDKASDRTKKTFRDKCEYYKVMLIELEDLFINESTGRSGNIVFGLMDKGLADEIERLYMEYRGYKCEQA